MLERQAFSDAVSHCKIATQSLIRYYPDSFVQFCYFTGCSLYCVCSLDVSVSYGCHQHKAEVLAVMLEESPMEGEPALHAAPVSCELCEHISGDVVCCHGDDSCHPCF